MTQKTLVQLMQKRIILKMSQSCKLSKDFFFEIVIYRQ
jgi:hypothetical protein